MTAAISKGPVRTLAAIHSVLILGFALCAVALADRARADFAALGLDRMPFDLTAPPAESVPFSSDVEHLQ